MFFSYLIPMPVMNRYGFVTQWTRDFQVYLRFSFYTTYRPPLKYKCKRPVPHQVTGLLLEVSKASQKSVTLRILLQPKKMHQADTCIGHDKK
jgi:hypothetical protein